MIRVKIFNTPVKVSFIVLPIIIIVWGVVTWLGLYWHPDRGLERAFFIGLVSTILLLVAEYGHPFAHTFSARFAGAPMDEKRNKTMRTTIWRQFLSWLTVDLMASL
jgi:hypothetical protein